MKKRIIALAMTAVLIVSFVGCNSAVDDVSTNVPTQEITEENNAPESNPTSVPTEIPTSVPTDDSESATQEPTPTLSVTNTPSVKPTQVVEPTKGVEDDVIPTAPIIKDDGDKDDNEDKPNKDDVPNFDDGEEEVVTPTPIVSEAPSPTPIVEVTKAPTSTPKVEVTPTLVPTLTPTLAPTSTPTPTPKPIITPNVGDDSGETIKLESLGISIPKRDEFNEDGLNKDKAWYGDVDDTQSGNELLDTLDSVTDALIENKKMSKGSQSFLFQDNTITFDWYQYNGNGDFKLVRNFNKGYYELSINVPLDYYKNYLGADVTQANHEVLKTMLSVITSDVNLVFSTLYQDIHLDECISMDTYTPVGECLIKYDNTQSCKNHYVYLIKPQ